MRAVRKLQTLIFVTLMVISCTVLFIGLLMNYRVQQQLLVDQTATLTEQNVSRSAGALNTMITVLEDTTKSIVKQLTPTMSEESLQEILSDSVELHAMIASITVFDDGGEVVDYAPTRLHLKQHANLYTQSWYQSAMQDDQSLYSIPHVQNLFVRQYPWVITSTVPFNYHKQRYIIAIDYKMSLFELFFGQGEIGQRGYTFIVDKENQIVYHPQQQLLASGLKTENIHLLKDQDQQVVYDKSENSIIAAKRVGKTKWRVVGKTYIQDMIAEAQHDILRVSMMIFVGLVALSSILSYLAANYIAKPIQALSTRMASWRQDTPVIDETNAVYEEAQQLNESYEQLLQEVHNLMEQIKEEEAALRKSERNILEAQIQPHFLYNTLESILWMTERGQTKEASTMVRSLGQLLRISLSKGKEMITLEDEFEQVRSYLVIQSMRYKGQFDYELILPETLKDKLTIKLLLQPLVENAIYHGISRLVDPGYIRVEARQQGDIIIITVQDNGQGMSPEQLELIQAHLQQQNESLGIGIHNVHERLVIYFGENYGLTINSELDEGTLGTLTLPVIEGA